jgi:hypothetical protein
MVVCLFVSFPSLAQLNLVKVGRRGREEIDR